MKTKIRRLMDGWFKRRAGALKMPGKRLLGGNAGATTMEYVILAVIIAAALVVAVIVFGRTIVTMFITSSQSASLQHEAAKQDLDMRIQDRNDDLEKAREYHDQMHK